MPTQAVPSKRHLQKGCHRHSSACGGLRMTVRKMSPCHSEERSDECRRHPLGRIHDDAAPRIHEASKSWILLRQSRSDALGKNGGIRMTVQSIFEILLSKFGHDRSFLSFLLRGLATQTERWPVMSSPVCW